MKRLFLFSCLVVLGCSCFLINTKAQTTTDPIPTTSGVSRTKEKTPFQEASVEDKAKFLEMQSNDAQESLAQLKNNPKAVTEYENAQKLVDTMQENYDSQNEKLTSLQSELEGLKKAENKDETAITQKKQEVANQKTAVEDSKENVKKATDNLSNTAIGKAQSNLGKTEEQKALWENVYNSSEFNISGLSVGNESQLQVATEDPEDEHNIFNKIINLAMGVIGTFAVLMLIVGGYFFITAAGDENQLQKGKNIFMYTIEGLALAFLSVLIVQAVFGLLFQ